MGNRSSAEAPTPAVVAEKADQQPRKNPWTIVFGDEENPQNLVSFGASNVTNVLAWPDEDNELAKKAILRSTGTISEMDLLDPGVLPEASDAPIGQSRVTKDNEFRVLVYYPKAPELATEEMAQSVQLFIVALLSESGIRFSLHPDLAGPEDLKTGEYKPFQHLTTPIDMEKPVPAWAKQLSTVHVNGTSGGQELRSQMKAAAGLALAGALVGATAYALGKKYKVKEKLLGKEESKGYGKYVALKRSQGNLSKVLRKFEKRPYSPQALKELRFALLDELEETGFTLGISNDGSSLGDRNKAEDQASAEELAQAASEADDEDITVLG